MLDENRLLYRQCADINLPEWESLTKSQLCNLYIETTSNSVKQGAFSALVYKCWNIFQRHFKDQPYIPVEDWYESMIDAILYVLKNHVWTNPESSLYQKENGPEMALHRCIWSRKLNVYGANKKPKRIINLNIMSTEDLYERAGVDPSCEMEDDAYIFKQYIKTIIEKNKIEYAIILDQLASGVDLSQLVKEIKQLNNVYIEAFAKRYNVDINKVDCAVKLLQNNKNLSQYIDYYITCLQRDQDTINYLS